MGRLKGLSGPDVENDPSPVMTSGHAKQVIFRMFVTSCGGLGGSGIDQSGLLFHLHEKLLYLCSRTFQGFAPSGLTIKQPSSIYRHLSCTVTNKQCQTFVFTYLLFDFILKGEPYM